jgi:hypothetical protein
VPVSPKEKASRTGSNGAREAAPSQVWGDERSLAFGAMTVVILVALALRLHGLNLRPLALGEAVTVELARTPLSEFWQSLRLEQPGVILYDIVLRLWISVGGARALNEAWMRGLSVLCSIATIPLLYLIGKRLFGAGGGLIAAVLLAVNPEHIRYAQDARGTSLVLLLGTAATYFFVAAVQDGGQGDWNWYAVLGSALVYESPFAAVVLVAHWISLQALKPCRVRAKFYHRALKWMVALTLPLWIWFSIHRAHFYSFSALSPVYRAPSGTSGHVASWLLVAYGVFVAIAMWGMVHAWRGKGESVKIGKSKDAWRIALPLAWLLVPVTVVFLVSIGKHIGPRNIFVAVPAMALAAAAGIEQIRPRRAMIPAAFALLALSALAVRSYQQEMNSLRTVLDGGGDFRSLTWFVKGAAEPRDAILFQPAIDRAGYEFYAGRFASRAPHIVDPGGGRLDYQALWPAQDLSADLYADLLKDYSRLWLVDGLGEANRPPNALESVLQRDFRIKEVLHFPGLSLKLYERRNPEQPGGISH